MAGYASAIGILTSAVILTAPLGAQAPAPTPRRHDLRGRQLNRSDWQPGYLSSRRIGAGGW